MVEFLICIFAGGMVGTVLGERISALDLGITLNVIAGLGGAAAVFGLLRSLGLISRLIASPALLLAGLMLTGVIGGGLATWGIARLCTSRR